MKKAVIGVMMLGIASLGYSQGANSTMEEVKLVGVEISPINESYMDKVADGTISQRVLELERKASRFNIKESRFFNPSGLSIVKFRQNNGNMLATYDGNGKILSTKEKYRNLPLPTDVRNTIFRENPEWTMHSNAYLVSYDHGKEVKKEYRAQIRKGNLKKNFSITVDGNKK
jgi:hypothetical protein